MTGRCSFAFFRNFAQDGNYRPWEHPYETLLDWGEKAAQRQEETPSPAIVRTWIQAYDAIMVPLTKTPRPVPSERGAFLCYSAKFLRRNSQISAAVGGQPETLCRNWQVQRPTPTSPVFP